MPRGQIIHRAREIPVAQTVRPRILRFARAFCGSRARFAVITENMTPLILVAGFLGAGKTTVLRHVLLDARGRNLNVGVIINEFGAVDVDGEILRDKAQSLASVAGGCACCSGQDDFVEAVVEMSAGDFDAILVEASGLADPLILLETLAAPDLLKRVQTAQIICVADASNWNATAGALGPLLKRQLMLADTIILNKVDLINETALTALRAKIAELNPNARVQTAAEGAIDFDWNFAARADKNLDLPIAPHADSHTVWVALPHPLERAALELALSELDDNIWRAKGFVRVRGESDLQLVQLSGGMDGHRTRIAPFAIPFGAAEPQLGLVFIGAGFDGAQLKRAFESLSLAF